MANAIEQLMGSADTPVQTPAIPLNADVPTQTHMEAPHHGGIQNVLGFLGDFLMSRLHMGTPYHDAREAEKLNAARLNDMQDPSHAFATVGDINPTFAAKLHEQATDDDRLQASRDSIAEMQASRLAALKQANKNSTLQRVANSFNIAMSKAKTPEEAQSAYDNFRSLKAHSQELSDPDISAAFDARYPEKFDPNTVAASIGEFTPVTAQWSNQNALTRINNQEDQFGKTYQEKVQHDRATEGVAQQNANSGAVRAGAAATSAGASASRASVYHDVNTNPDGTPIRASDPSRHPASSARPLPPGASGAPAVGYRNRHGLAFQGGDPNNPSNWKK